MEPIVYRMALGGMRGVGPELARQLLEVVGGEERLFTLSEAELRSLTGSVSRILGDNYRHELLLRAERELSFVRDNGIKVTYFTDPDYPRRLLEAPDAPLVYYSLGPCPLDAPHTVSIVGTRHATAYGLSFVDRLVGDLAAALPDLVVVSGLAYGIDIAAHRAAMRHGLRTVAVMARGLNSIYPSAHRGDAIAIVRQGGALVSEYRSSDEVHKGNFLARNRIIAALTDCTVVAESARVGGALVTASIAGSYNREVMALPGRTTDEFSSGCNRLIQNNKAAVITEAADLLNLMRWETRAPAARQRELFPDLTADQRAVVEVLRAGGGDLHINDIAGRLELPVYRVMSTLVELDCRGVVLPLAGGRYSMA